jgi:predicted ATPase
MDLLDLQRLTVVKLREEALRHEGISGVNGMNKEQLIAALAPVYGIDLEAETRAMRERLAASKGELKQEITNFKKERNAALEDHDYTGTAQARKEIKKRKRRLRHMVKTGHA